MNSAPLCAVLASLCVVSLQSNANAATYYVSPTGSDAAGDGSNATPWATVGHAVGVGVPAEGGHTILVRDGVYDGSVYVSRGFPQPVVVRAEHPYRAKLTNISGQNEAIRIYVVGSVNIAFEGFVISNAHATYTCPNGRETYFLIHIQDAEDVALRDNIIFGNNAPGRCNELLKINRGDAGAYPRNILVQGNVFYDPANAAGSDLIDAVRPGEVEIVDNIFFSDPSIPNSQSFITLKRQVNDPPVAPKSPRFIVARNVFLNWSGHTDQAFVQFGEDGNAELMVTDALVENNLIIGNSAIDMAAPFQFKGSQQIAVRANTIVGDLPGGSYGFRIGTEGENPPVAGFEIRNNIWSDPTGTMGSRLVNTYGDVDNGSILLDHNLFFNGGGSLPTDGDVTIDTDANRVVGDPLLATNQSSIILPRWNEASAAFPSGSATIREEFLRLVETYGALGSGSPAMDAADAANMPAVDIRNLPRDGSPDIGAYELNAGGASGVGGAATGGTDGGGAGGATGGGSGAGGASGEAGATGGPSGTGGTSGATGAQSTPSEEDSGCGCRVGPSGKGLGSWASLWLLGFAFLRRRGAWTCAHRT